MISNKKNHLLQESRCVGTVPSCFHSGALLQLLRAYPEDSTFPTDQDFFPRLPADNRSNVVVIVTRAYDEYVLLSIQKNSNTSSSFEFADPPSPLPLQ